MQLDSNQFWLLIGVGCAELGGFVFTTLGFTYGGPSVALYGFTGIVWAFMADLFVLNNPVSIH